MSSLYYTYFIRGKSREPVLELPRDVEEGIRSVFTNLRSVGDGEWVGESDLAEMPLQHDFRQSFSSPASSGLVWLSPVDLGRDQRWATEELAERFARVREFVGLTSSPP